MINKTTGSKTDKKRIVSFDLDMTLLDQATWKNGTAEIVRLADWDTIKTNWFANEAIRYILSLSPDALKKYMLVPLEPPLIS